MYQRFFIMAALRSGCVHYILQLWLHSSFFFPRLFSAVGDWMSTILPHMMWPYSANLERRSEMCCTWLAGNTGCKNYPQNRHLRTIAQLCRTISWQQRSLLLPDGMYRWSLHKLIRRSIQSLSSSVHQIRSCNWKLCTSLMRLFLQALNQ